MRRTAQELAADIGARMEGDGAVELRCVAAPERAGPHDLIYVEAAKNVPRAASSAALCVVAPENVAIAGKTLLRHAQPKVAFAKAAARLLEPAPIASGIHPTAMVAPLARIAANVSIGAYAVIGEDVHVGEGTQIGAHCVVAAGGWIGAHCRIHPRVTLYSGVRIGDRVEVHAGAEIGDDVEIGANTTIDRGSLDDTRIAEGVKLDNLVHVGHNCKIGAHTVIAAQTGISGSCVFGKNVVIGGQAGFGEQVHLEDGAVIGGQSGVLGGKIVRSGQTVWGTPARALDKFKEQYAWQARLPELVARIKELESKIEGCKKNGK